MNQASAQASKKKKDIKGEAVIEIESASEVSSDLNKESESVEKSAGKSYRTSINEDFDIISSSSDLNEKLARPNIASDLSMHIDSSHDSLSR